MEKAMTENIAKILKEIIGEIKESKEYRLCLDLKKQMDNNTSLKLKIEEIKVLQKKYVKSNFQDENVKKELKEKEEVLNSIPLFIEYNRNLEIVNQKIELVKEEINDYFLEKFNILK